MKNMSKSRKPFKISVCIFCALLCSIAANSTLLIASGSFAVYAPGFAASFALGFFCSMIPWSDAGNARLFFLGWGCSLLQMFVFMLIPSVIYHSALLFVLMPSDWKMWLLSAGVCFSAHLLVFWSGAILIYTLSVQMGIKHRVLGLVLGMVPIANLFMLKKMISVSKAEVEFESEKIRLNKDRRRLKVCETKYPVLLVHGVFFRDFKRLNYWGRIPSELERNGAQVFYGEQNSAASVWECGKALCSRIDVILKETGCEKVNIIAHSKGGLDARAAIHMGFSDKVASLTTVNTPHRGCEFADYLLGVVPAPFFNRVARAYNTAAARLGDKDPDFAAAVGDLTADACKKFNETVTDIPESVYTHGIASKMEKATGGKFPLNFTYHLAKYFDGDGDGLVSVENAKWGEDFTLVTPKYGRGVSHGDMIDLNRENIPGFDVREFYVDIVKDLKRRGL